MTLVTQIHSFQQLESTVMPYLQVLSEFREGVRKIAREKKGKAPCWVPQSCWVTCDGKHKAPKAMVIANLGQH